MITTQMQMLQAARTEAQEMQEAQWTAARMGDMTNDALRQAAELHERRWGVRVAALDVELARRADMSVGDYYRLYRRGARIASGLITSPSLSVSGTYLQWVVPEQYGPAVIEHMREHGITKTRTMVRDGKMAIEASK